MIPTQEVIDRCIGMLDRWRRDVDSLSDKLFPFYSFSMKGFDFTDFEPTPLSTFHSRIFHNTKEIPLLSL